MRNRIVRIARIAALFGTVVLLAACGGSGEGEPDEASNSPDAVQFTAGGTAESVPLFAPTSIEDLFPSIDMLDGSYSLQSSRYVSYDRVEAIPGFVEGRNASFVFDINSVSEPEGHMLSFGVLCFEFDSSEGAGEGFGELISILEDAPGPDPNEVQIEPLPAKYQALKGTVRIEGETESADHIIIQTNEFACQYTGIALCGLHAPLHDVRKVVERIIQGR